MQEINERKRIELAWYRIENKLDLQYDLEKKMIDLRKDFNAGA